MCGKDVPSLRRATIEGTVMSVCGGCVKYGVEIAGPKTEVTGRSSITQAVQKRATRGRERDIYQDMQEELKPEAGKLVREARQRKGWTTEELAKRISEREANVKHVESGTLHPDDSLVKRLERELGIKLMEKPEVPAGIGGRPLAGKTGSADKGLTLGDMIKDAMAKQKKSE